MRFPGSIRNAQGQLGGGGPRLPQRRALPSPGLGPGERPTLRWAAASRGAEEQRRAPWASLGAVGLGDLATRLAASGSGPPLAHGCRAPLVTPSGAPLCGRVAVCSSISWPMTLGRFQVVDTENEAAISVCKQVFAQTSFCLALSPG